MLITPPLFDMLPWSMNIYINSEKSPAAVQAKATGSPLSSFKVKRGAVEPLGVTVLGTQTGSGLRMGIKAKSNYRCGKKTASSMCNCRWLIFLPGSKIGII